MLRSEALGPHADTPSFCAITHGLRDRLARRQKSAREMEAIAQQIAARSNADPHLLTPCQELPALQAFRHVPLLT